MAPLTRITADLSPADAAEFLLFCDRVCVNLDDADELQAARLAWVTWDRPELPRQAWAPPLAP